MKEFFGVNWLNISVRLQNQWLTSDDGLSQMPVYLCDILA